MPEESQQPAPQPQVTTTTQPHDWKKVGLTVLIILVVAGLLVGAYWFLVLNKSSEDSDLTSPVPKVITKTATESAKESTSSAEKDENADWRILTTETRESDSTVFSNPMTVKFSFKYPPDYKVINDEGTKIATNDSNYQLKLTTKGAIAVFARLTSDAEKPTSSTEAKLGGLNALRGVSESSEFTTVTYYVSSVSTAEGTVEEFALFCNVIPKGGVNVEKVCDLVAETFKFLN